MKRVYQGTDDTKKLCNDKPMYTKTEETFCPSMWWGHTWDYRKSMKTYHNGGIRGSGTWRDRGSVLTIPERESNHWRNDHDMNVQGTEWEREWVGRHDNWVLKVYKTVITTTIRKVARPVAISLIIGDMARTTFHET